MRITSMELWDTLEEKVLVLSKDVSKVDEILSKRLVNLVNHFNGNMARNQQHVCIESINQILGNITKEGYYRDRKYSKAEEDMVLSFSEELLVLNKVLVSEYKTFMTKEKEEVKVEEKRLPNINTDKAMNMFEIKNK